MHRLISVLHILSQGSITVKCFCSYRQNRFFRESDWSLSSGELHLIPQVAVDVNGSKFFITYVNVISILKQCISAVMHL